MNCTHPHSLRAPSVTINYSVCTVMPKAHNNIHTHRTITCLNIGINLTVRKIIADSKRDNNKIDIARIRGAQMHTIPVDHEYVFADL